MSDTAVQRKRSPDDFDAPVRRALAERAQHHCSKPDCRKPTVAASAESPQATKVIGVAAHLAGARRGAARYDDSMTSAQRSAIENGIWLCCDHAKEIDDDEVTFTMDVLRGWQVAHAKWTAERFGQRQAPMDARSVGVLRAAYVRWAQVSNASLDRVVAAGASGRPNSQVAALHAMNDARQAVEAERLAVFMIERDPARLDRLRALSRLPTQADSRRAGMQANQYMWQAAIRRKHEVSRFMADLRDALHRIEGGG